MLEHAGAILFSIFFLAAMAATWGRRGFGSKLSRACSLGGLCVLSWACGRAWMDFPSLLSRPAIEIAASVAVEAGRLPWFAWFPCAAGLALGLLATRRPTPSEIHARENDRLMAEGMRGLSEDDSTGGPAKIAKPPAHCEP